MPRTQPLPERERQICERLGAFRQANSITRATVARQIGMRATSLANIERGQAPLRFVAAYNFCLTFNRSLAWLATGQLPRSPFTPLSVNIINKIGPRTLFSAAYDHHLAKFVEARLRELAEDAGVPLEKLDVGRMVYDRRRLGVSLAESHFEMTMDFLRERAATMPEETKIAFANQLGDVGFKFWDGTSYQTTVNKEPLRALTATSQKGKTLPVKSEISTLIERVKRLTIPAGSKAELARSLGVAPARVSEWLAGKKEPGGEYALRMLRWLEDRCITRRPRRGSQTETT